MFSGCIQRLVAWPNRPNNPKFLLIFPQSKISLGSKTKIVLIKLMEVLQTQTNLKN